MRYLVLLLLILSLGLYLSYTYAHFFYKVGSTKLPDPNLAKTYIFKNNNFDTKVYKYVALGDSLTAGVGATSHNFTFAYKLAEKISQDKKTSVELRNLGIPGLKSTDLIELQLDKTIYENPDLVTILIGINDMHDWIMPQTFEKNLQHIVSDLKERTNAKIVFINIPYLGTGNIKNTPVEKFFDWRINSLNKVIDKVSQENKIQTIDLYTPSKLQSQTDPQFYAQDDFHPSNEGYKYWSEIINASINP